MTKTFALAALALALSFGAVRAQEVQATTQEQATVTKAKREATPGQLAARERIKACSGQWKSAKAAQNTKTPDGLTWPKYWSACNARLKAEKNA